MRQPHFTADRSMRTKTTLFLLVLVITLGGIAYYVHRDWDVRGRFEANRLNVLGPDAVAPDYLRFELRDGPEEVVLEKRRDDWLLTSPVQWPANINAVEYLIAQLQLLRRESSFPVDSLAGSGRSLADYGLEPPQGSLTYGSGSRRRTLLIGNATETGQNVYVMFEDGPEVLVVKQTLLDTIRRREELRSRHVFDTQPFEVRHFKVQLAAGNFTVLLERDGEKWRLTAPVQARADRAAVDTLLKQLLDLTVDSFWNQGTPDLYALGLANPAYLLTIEGPAGRRDELLLAPVPDGKDPHLFYGMRDDNPTVFTVRVPFIDRLRNAQVGLRDRRVVEVEPQRVTSLMLKASGRPPVTLQLLDPPNPSWQVLWRPLDGGLVPLPGDDETIGTLIREIAELRAVPEEGFVRDFTVPSDREQYGFAASGDPPWRITITQRIGQGPDFHSEELHIGARVGDRMYVADDEDHIYLVDRGLLDHLSPEPYVYRDRELKRLTQGARVTGLTLKRLANDETILAVTLSAPEQTWEAALASETPERRAALLSLVEQLRNLHAERIVAPNLTRSVPNRADQRPWTWELQATIALEGGATQQSERFIIFLDDYAGGTELLMGVPEPGLVATAEPAFVDAVRPLILQRPEPGPTGVERAEPMVSPPASVPAEVVPVNPSPAVP